MIILRIGGFFTGIGAHICACERLKNRVNFKYVFQCEIDEKTVDAYNLLHGYTPNLGDITEVDNIGGINTVDILFWTPPCQDISLAGRLIGNKKNSGTRSSLAFEVPRILQNTPAQERPTYLVMEEVDGMIYTNFKENFKELLRSLSALGYQHSWGIMNARDYGMPQFRKRCFVISKLGGPAPNIPKPIPLEKCLSDYLDSEPLNPRYYIPDDRIKGFYYYKQRPNKKSGLIELYRLPSFKRVQLSRIYSPRGISPTIHTASGGCTVAKICITEEKPKSGKLPIIRYLTESECFKLQGYEEYEINSLLAAKKENGKPKYSRHALMRFAGNSVCVSCFKEILAEIIKDIQRPKITLDYWLTTKNYTHANIGNYGNLDAGVSVKKVESLRGDN